MLSDVVNNIFNLDYELSHLRDTFEDCTIGDLQRAIESLADDVQSLRSDIDSLESDIQDKVRDAISSLEEI